MYYSDEITALMLQHHQSLSEKDKRRYAAIEAVKLGRGGIIYIARVLGVDRNTIAKGIKELKSESEHSRNHKRIRRPVGGRKTRDSQIPNLNERFLEVLKNHTAGDPMSEKIKWTNLTHQQIVEGLKAQETIVSTTVVKKLLNKNGYVKRKAQKQQTTGVTKNRNEQFENLALITAQYELRGNPIVSMDTKKKEFIGNLYRAGSLYTTEVVTTYDHDFWSLAEGKVVPHGIYDLQHNRGYLNLGISKYTSEFACESIKLWWINYGKFIYPQANLILIKCDGGGSNNSNHQIFKSDLQKLVDELGIEIRIAHYPPYTSKYNPIEHRLFPHVTRACQGVIFTSLELVKKLMAKTHTKTGLSVVVNVIDKIYETGRKVANGFKETMKIIFDEYLPKWNYRAVPTI
ncbi:ISAzo13 family transposase [Microcoleus sp. A2-C5]|uniref:ISAzo13 family transposase n=1 Tax=unclassified Microcoleus TaxID=2642155 RepID=UPI002FD773B2